MKQTSDNPNRTKTPLKSIRSYCLWCCDRQAGEVRNCPKANCEFYKFRMGKKNEKGSLIKVIRKRCFDCGLGTKKSIAICNFENCPLFPYRKGKSPAHKAAWADKTRKPNYFKKQCLIAQKNSNRGMKKSI